MFSCTVVKANENSGWRSSHENGGGALFELASHLIDLVNFLIGKPDKITGSSLNFIYSKNVEDAALSTFLYKNETIGTLSINWSETSYRKPAIKIEIFGDGGRILVDLRSLKIFLNRPNKQHNLHQGWNTLFLADIIEPVPFYVRGNEYTSQLYHFIDCIKNRTIKNQCSFSDGLNALEVIDGIFKDYEKNGRL
jgi:predicted dehydrogenase